jgi:hypothetical protein
MDKKYIYWGLGLVAVGGLAYYFMSGNRSGGAKSIGDSSTDTLTDGANSSANPNATDAGTALDSTLGTFTSAGGGRRQIRVNCRAEARNRGLRGRERREFRRECKRNGGFDDGAEDFLGASGNSGFGCTTANGMVGTWVNVPQGTFPETYKRTCVSRGFRDRA